MRRNLLPGAIREMRDAAPGSVRLASVADVFDEGLFIFWLCEVDLLRNVERIRVGYSISLRVAGLLGVLGFDRFDDCRQCWPGAFLVSRVVHV